MSKKRTKHVVNFTNNFFTIHRHSNDRDRWLSFIWTIATESNRNQPDACTKRKTSSEKESSASKYQRLHAANRDRQDNQNRQVTAEKTNWFH